MRYIRSGTCNQCGECCGFPRKTDHGQNNPWPTDWPEGLAALPVEETDELYPVFRIVGHKDWAGLYISGKNHFHWIWVKDHGLCKMDVDQVGHTHWDQRCPFLSAKLEDGTVPCLLYGTVDHDVWQKHCDQWPPKVIEDPRSMEAWRRNCPSCSFVFEEEK